MNLKFRQATREDLPEIVRMLADDFLGSTRERCAHGVAWPCRRLGGTLGFCVLLLISLLRLLLRLRLLSLLRSFLICPAAVRALVWSGLSVMVRRFGV